MGCWSHKKVFRLAKGFTGRSKNCYGLALRKVFHKLRYAYRDRKVKKRLVRRQWIHTISASVREQGINYSKFQFGLTKSNIDLDRKILAELAVTEPFSFKAVVEEVNKQADLKAMMKCGPKYLKIGGVSFNQALEKGFLRTTAPTPKELEEIEKSLIEPQNTMFGLRFPQKDAKTPKDYMRLSYKEEDLAWLEDQKRKTMTMKE